MSGRYYLTEDPITGRIVRVFKSDSSTVLPCTEATAYVDVGYSDNNAPYFADINQAIDWVVSRGIGQIVVSSNYDTITLQSGVSVLIMPNVLINNIIINTLNDISVVGGHVGELSIDNCSNVYIDIESAYLLDIKNTSGSYFEVGKADSIASYSSNGNKYNIKNYVGSFDIGGELTNTLYGNALCDRLHITGGLLNIYNLKVVGETSIVGLANIFDSEFICEKGIPTIHLEGKLMLQGCWIRSALNTCIEASGTCSLIIDDTKLYCDDKVQPCITSTNNLVIQNYGNSVSRTDVDLNCTVAINPLVVNDAMRYKFTA